MSKLVIYAICSAAFAVLTDYLMRRKNANRPPYRYGFFLVAFLSLVALSSLYSLLEHLRDGVLSISDLLIGGVGLIAAAGIARRRRYGWWAGSLLVVATAVLIAFTVALDVVWITVTAGAAAVLVVAINTRYARRLSSGSRTDGLAACLRSGPTSAAGEMITPDPVLQPTGSSGRLDHRHVDPGESVADSVGGVPVSRAVGG